MQFLGVLRGVLALTVVFLGPCILGCGGKVDQQYRPKATIQEWNNDEWAFVLKQVVTPDGKVRHEMLKANTNGVRDALYRYIGQINAAGPENRPELFPTEKHRLAYYCNAYSAVCMYRVVERNFPSKMNTSGIFILDSVPVGGKSMNLDYLEKTYLRPFDPRIHFAINCMSASCPPLRAEPFEADKLDAQFDEMGRIFLSDPRGAYREDGKVVISEIFRFYQSDFTDAHAKKTGKSNPTILEALQPFAADDSPVRGATDYKFQDYDWSLNRP